MFGQCKAALGHLVRNSVTTGDLFLFFGWFRQTDFTNRKLCYKDGAQDIQAFFGWLQVGEVWKVEGEQTTKLQELHPPWAWEHPHFQDRTAGYGTIFVAAKDLKLCGKTTGLPGAGVFSRCTQEAHLTWPYANRRSIWKLPRFFHKEGQARLSYHHNPRRWERQGDDWRLQSAFRGQEFILNLEPLGESDRRNAQNWAEGLIQDHI